MNLIDRDKLPRHGNRGGIVQWHDIEKAPTVDAVPIEFIEKKIDEYREKEDQTKDEPLAGYFEWVRTSERRSLEWLLLDWKAEQENQK